MKKLFSVLVVAMLVAAAILPVFAAGDPPVITLQPQHYTIPVGSTVIYRVEAEGQNLSATWYIEFMGQTCEITQGMASEQWRAYVGEDSGPTRDGNNFYCNLTKVQPELSGAKVWCVVEDGHYDVASAKAYVMVDENAGYFPNVIVPAHISTYQNAYVSIICDAKSADGSALSYTWYETSTGLLENIIAMDRGGETESYLICDTSSVGTRYYVCKVETASLGTTYSSAVEVEVMEGVANETKITTESIPEAVSGETYGVKIECSDPTAEFGAYYNPGSANELEKTGLTINGAGEISGVAGEPGEYTFTIYAAGDYGEDYATYTLKINEKSAAAEDTKDAEDTNDTNDTEDLTGKGVGDDQGEGIITIGALNEGDGGEGGGSGVPTWMIIALAAAVVIIGALVAVIIIKSVKDKEKPEN